MLARAEAEGRAGRLDEGRGRQHEGRGGEEDERERVGRGEDHAQRRVVPGHERGLVDLGARGGAAGQRGRAGAAGRETTAAIDGAQKALDSVDATKLDAERTRKHVIAKDFLAQANEALTRREYERAQGLAVKAKLLAEEIAAK